MEKRTTYILGAAVVVILIVLGIWWKKERPERVIDEAIQNLSETKSGTFHATLDFENSETTKRVLGEEGKIQLTLNGVFDRQSEPPALQSEVVTNIKTESVTVEATGEIRAVNDKFYYLITKGPSVYPLLNRLRGQWIVQNITRQGTASGPTIEGPLVIDSKKVGTERIDNVTTTKYTATATQAALVRMINQMTTLVATPLTDQQVGQLKNGIAKVEALPVELWITPTDHTLQQVHTVLPLPDGTTVNFTLQVKNPNQAVAIGAPEGAQTLPQVLGALSTTNPTPTPR